MIDLKNKKIGILGLGEENLALVEYLTKLNLSVTICDKKREGELKDYLEKMKNANFDLCLGPGYLDNLSEFDLIFRTPGLPYFNPKIQSAKKAGVEVSSQTKLFFELCPCPIIGVTGTKGKGTTSTLIYEILNNKSEIRNPKSETNPKSKIQNPKFFLGGNIGHPPIEFLDKLTKDDVVVLELSSFQLQDMEASPHIAVVLDIKVDHLDYHQDEKEYIFAKANILKHQKKTDLAIINADYFTSVELATLTPAQVYWFSRRKSIDDGAFVGNKQEFILRVDNNDQEICKTNEVLLKGEHNFENILAAITASYLAGAEIDAIRKGVKSFKGLEHRLEFVRDYRGISFYNDSFSTTPDTTIAAIKSFTQPIILLVGGSEKKADYSKLGEIIQNSSVKTIISIGETSKRIIETIGENSSIEIDKEILSLDQAVKKAFEKANAGDVILLSPASASFDRFKNYKDRGNRFKNNVMSL